LHLRQVQAEFTESTEKNKGKTYHLNISGKLLLKVVSTLNPERTQGKRAQGVTAAG
jgi:hypothetical protein